MSELSSKHIQVSNPVLGTKKIKPAPSAGFPYLGPERVPNRAKKKRFLDMQYRPATIYPEDLSLDTKKWCVQYRFMHPITGKYERFKVYEDINRYKGEDKIQYAKNLRDAVNLSLQNGYSPFEELDKVDVFIKHKVESREAEAAGNKSNYSLVRGVNLFLAAKIEKGLSDSSISAYTTTAELIKNWLNENGMLLTPAKNITGEQYLTILKEQAVKNNWENKTYNNYLLYTETILNWLADPLNGGIIPINPIKGADQRKTGNNRPAAYTDEELTKILELVRNKSDIYVEGLILTCYYAAVRSKAEMRALKIKNILFDRDLLLLCADETKANREDYIPLDPILKKFYVEHGLNRLPLEWYVFGNKDQPGPVQAAENYFASKFRPYREALHIDDRKKLYNFKHTRGIHLANAKVSPYSIMQFFRHTSLEQTMIYLRDLGCVIDFSAVENSRMI